jgi:hypothetical protein
LVGGQGGFQESDGFEMTFKLTDSPESSILA